MVSKAERLSRRAHNTLRRRLYQLRVNLRTMDDCLKRRDVAALPYWLRKARQRVEKALRCVEG